MATSRRHFLGAAAVAGLAGEMLAQSQTTSPNDGLWAPDAMVTQ